MLTKKQVTMRRGILKPELAIVHVGLNLRVDSFSPYRRCSRRISASADVTNRVVDLCCRTHRSTQL